MLTVHPARARTLNQHSYQGGPLVYWMSRDQRVHDNWALALTLERARAQGVPAAVIFSLSPGFLGATLRHYDFMLEGLAQVESELDKLKIPFFLLLGEPDQTLPDFVRTHQVGGVVCDFSPLKRGRTWRAALADSLSIPLVEVDAHNVVPVWTASPKQEVGARTLRPKIQRLLPEFLTEFPVVVEETTAWPNRVPPTDWAAVRAQLQVDKSVGPVSWIKPGEAAAHQALTTFIQQKLPHYHQRRNDPTLDGQSELSPYLHFGQLSAQRVALAVEQSDAPAEAKEVYLEELIVRRELSDNFCFYNSNYDSFAGFPTWAQKSLDAHRTDTREFGYTRDELEHAKTHDPLWNAAQLEMTLRGKMHGYLRMYWAKKILEWTESPEQALAWAIYLNDRYQLDGRDPNGYTGVAWSIGGVHDRPWFERPVFGVIRYMNFNGAKRKFDVAAYCAKYA